MPTRSPGRLAEPLWIPAADGLEVAATRFPPTAGGPGEGRTVLLAPATGVRRRFYFPFCGWLAARGFEAVVWDWRGVGDTRPDDLRGFRATMAEWGELDFTGVIAWAERRTPARRIVAVGHSYGGQGLGLAPNRDRIERLVTVAVQSGYYGHWPWPKRALFAALWHVVVPGLTRALGYFPAHLLGLGQDLPAGVALQWAEWCRTPDYMGRWEGHRSFTAPVLGWSFSDDTYGPREAIEWLHERFGGPVDLRWLDPREAGADEVGHFGFFREGRTPRLWEESAAFLAGG